MIPFFPGCLKPFHLFSKLHGYQQHFLWLAIISSLYFFALPSFSQEPNVSATVTSAVPQSIPTAQSGQAMETAPSAASTLPAPSQPSWFVQNRALTALIVGIASILFLMIAVKMHAFVSLILAAFVVSLFVPGTGAEYVTRVATEFGKNTGNIGIVIAMAAIIGKCMLDSGSADRVVQWFLSIFGQKRSPLALAGSGFLLGIPVFFDTVFYLLVPLARSLFRQTKKNYVLYLCAIAAGGAVTHTMVPPTPGPLFVSSILGVNIGVMILVGIMVGLPCAAMGLIYSWWCNQVMPIEMRPLGTSDQEGTVLPKHPPSLLFALAPVVLPVFLISLSTILTLMADSKMAATLQSSDVQWPVFQQQVRSDLASAEPNLSKRIAGHAKMSPDVWQSIQQNGEMTEAQKSEALAALNRVLLDPKLYQKESLRAATLASSTEELVKKLGPRSKLSEIQRTNRSMMENVYTGAIQSHEWLTPLRRWSNFMELLGDPNFALIVAALVSIYVLWRCQERSFTQLSADMEEALLSGSVIILITAAGGAFGEMLRMVNISDWVRNAFQGSAASGIGLLLLAFAVAVVLKIAQGSSTVAMIVTAGIMSSIIGDNKPEFHLVYVATTISAGSLVGSWMNDSGFWIFSKMGGLTVAETLKSWSVLLSVIGFTGLAFSLLFSQLLPLV